MNFSSIFDRFSKANSARTSRIYVDGVLVYESAAKVIDIKVEAGDLRNIQVRGGRHQVTINGNVGGDVDVGGSVTCGHVRGSVSAGSSVNCGTIRGSIDVGGAVRRN